jgi:membrane protein implicated in regulation of membrane protease activity
MLFSFGVVHDWWIWVALVIIFSLIEIFTLGLTTVWFAISALVMVFLSFTNMPLTAQFLIFLAIATLLLIFTRPIAVKKFKIGREKTNVDSLVGKHALVVKTIGEFERGEAKINGLIWSARSEDDSEITQGSKCEILRIEGVQLIVRKLTEEKL